MNIRVNNVDSDNVIRPEIVNTNDIAKYDTIAVPDDRARTWIELTDGEYLYVIETTEQLKKLGVICLPK